MALYKHKKGILRPQKAFHGSGHYVERREVLQRDHDVNIRYVEGTDKDAPVYTLLGGYGKLWGDPNSNQFAKQLRNKTGGSVLQIDFGGMPFDIDTEGRFGTEFQGTPASNIEDILTVLNYFPDRKAVLMSTSFSVNSAFYSAMENKNIAKIVTFSPYPDYIDQRVMPRLVVSGFTKGLELGCKLSQELVNRGICKIRYNQENMKQVTDVARAANHYYLAYTRHFIEQSPQFSLLNMKYEDLAQDLQAVLYHMPEDAALAKAKQANLMSEWIEKMRAGGVDVREEIFAGDGHGCTQEMRMKVLDHNSGLQLIGKQALMAHSDPLLRSGIEDDQMCACSKEEEKACVEDILRASVV